MRRESILQGTVTIPKQLIEVANLNESETEIAQEMFDELFYALLVEKSVDSVRWLEKFGQNKFFQIQHYLHISGWVRSVVQNNYAFMEMEIEKLLKWVTIQEINDMKYRQKIMHHMLQSTESKHNDMVSIAKCYNNSNGTVVKTRMATGLVRDGFKKAGNSKFSYDTEVMKSFRDDIIQNMTKGLGTSSKEVTYDEIIEDLVDMYISSNGTYTLGSNISDPRGRSIFQASRKVFNPVANKEARALLCHPSKTRRLTDKGELAVYKAIAELSDFKALGLVRPNNVKAKIALGKKAYEVRHYPNDDLHARIWLTRIYDNLDRHYFSNDTWTVPIELDVTSSIIAINGVLLNNHEYLRITNLYSPNDELDDAWTIPGIPSRELTKKSATPMLYGSSAKPAQLWDKAKLEYDTKILNCMNKEITSGRFHVANELNKYIVGNVKPKESMEVHIGDEKFTVYCNKFNWGLAQTKVYKMFDSTKPNRISSVTRELFMKPDLEQFKRFFVTLLIHNLDSQIANNICKKLDWVLPNHDAFIIHPNDIDELTTVYLEEINKIYKNRNTILMNYFYSIGIYKKFKYMDFNKEELVLSGNSLK